ncbi:MAG: sigma-70 family RNA polymerase sigma factor [Planctomycetia bacterium]
MPPPNAHQPDATLPATDPAGGGDPVDAFARELTRHQARLRGLIRCLLFDRKDVEDVWQDTNVTLLKKASDFSPGTDFWAWASQVARYQVLTHCKKLKRDKLVLAEELLQQIAVEVIERSTDFEYRREALDACLAKLPQPQRQLLEMRYGPKTSIETVAASMSRTPNAIRQALFRIRGALLACMEKRLATVGLT